MKYTVVSFLLLLIINACSPKESKESQLIDTPSPAVVHVEIKYATGFTIKYENGAKWVNVPRPYQGAAKGFTYLLVNKGDSIPAHADDVQVIETPISSIVCTSTTHIPLLDYLEETNALVGFPSLDYVSSEKTRKRIDTGEVTDVGVDKGMNLELLVSLAPDMVMAYTMNNDFGQFRQIESAEIPVVINAEYLEAHPLGRAEWIKFMGLFFNKENMADSIFNEIENNYLQLQEKVADIKVKPTVLSGVVYGDTWYMPGGQNYASKLIRDAGGNYLWGNDSTSGFLELSFEAVYDQAENSDFWIGVGSYKNLVDMKETDERYSDFSAFKNENVYTYNARKGAKGGSEFLELGYLRPDLILSDLIKIMHPDLMRDEELFFHARLQSK